MSGREIFIVGGGHSLQSFDFERLANKNTITINKSMFDVPHPDYMITMDFTFINKVGISRFDSINTTKVFVANFVPAYMEYVKGRIIDTRHGLIYDLHDFDLIIKCNYETGFGFSFREFRHGNNSGFCALQLAVLLGYDTIYLLGIDLNLNGQSLTTGKSHYHDGYGESLKSFNTKLQQYYENFAVGLSQIKASRPGIKVYSCSNISRLNQVIPYKMIDEVL